MQVELGDPWHTDITFRGSWPEVVNALTAARRGEDLTPPLQMEGSPEVLDLMGPAFATAQSVTKVETLLPDPVPEQCDESRSPRIEAEG